MEKISTLISKEKLEKRIDEIATKIKKLYLFVF